MDIAARLVAVLVVIALTGAFGLWWRRRQGRVTDGHGGFDPDQLAAVGLEADGAEALAVLLSSPTCAPCRTVRRILDEVSRDRAGLRWVTVDAADHLDLARAHHVMRVPTLFLLDPGGRILARTSGVPARRDLEQVLDREAAPAGR